MKKANLNTKLLSLTILVAVVLTIFHDINTNANTLDSIESSRQPVSEIVRDKSNYQADAGKLSERALVGSWKKTIVSKSGEESQVNVYYESNGKYIQVLSLKNGIWAVNSRGTWELSKGILYETTETGKVIEGKLDFVSNNVIAYQSRTEPNSSVNGKWQRITGKSNLSAARLAGTWSLAPMLFINGKIRNGFRQAILTLVELNADGTFRYKKSDARFLVAGIKIYRNSGTWQYFNNEIGGGLLTLKNRKGQIIMSGSIRWLGLNSFAFINVSTFDRSNNKWSIGKIERFSSTDLRID